ncbi:rho GTPase-activating protein 100F-like isoform X1 [Limulus polyphemus]|uniref:Rho GTPase-activating protein 100F-like isoform X1 n=1 Tax=Limulus polyphemus TaxID=6850 RepID=A0ABM1SCI2_LIMPO|nr:rho GTPase-activating protein 100F-like isoform X1 [Limulus polyphemus]XP_022241337.1 rho GTPase-activating protein 100F-like isoform X1 [Limulus polyphemus]
MSSFAQPPRLREKVKHLLSSKMLCCGRRKETGEGDLEAGEDGSRRAGPSRQRIPEMVVQSDFRKVSGISTEIFRQIEAVENEYDATTAANIEAVEKRGEMIIRVLDPRNLGRVGAETSKKHLSGTDSNHTVQFVEIIKRPGQTLGLYIREGDGTRLNEGVFISRIALESAVYDSGILRVGDEILAVNLVDVRQMSLDDVVIIMSIPRRLVLTIRSKISGRASIHASHRVVEEIRQPVVVWKKEVEEEGPDDISTSNNEDGQLSRVRNKGLSSEMLGIERPMSGREGLPSEEHLLFYNSQPRGMHVSRTSGVDIKDEERLWSREAVEQVPANVVIRQPMTQQVFPKTLENLAQRVHTFHAGPSLTARKSQMSASHTLLPSRPERGTTARHRLWDEHGSFLASKPTRLLRTESEQKIPTEREEWLERYASRGIRPALRMARTMQPRGRVRRYERDVPPHTGILRRRSVVESCSDTEVQTNSKDSMLYRQYSLGRAAPIRGTAGQVRSNSLPRARAIELEPRQPRQSVRFVKKTLPYDSQEDSDGAVSAPELPSFRSGRRGVGRRGPSPNVFTAAEYRAWMSRAPSTSAIYERVRRGRGMTQVQPLPRIAHSAESLLDSFRQEEQAGLHSSQVQVRHSLLRPGSEDIAQTSRFLQSQNLEQGRQVPHPTPIKPSEDRMHLLTLNPREFFKYKPEKDSETVLQTNSFTGLLWVHLLAGRGLRPTGHADHFRDLYCVIECDHIHKARTVVRTGDHSFDWDEIFELDLVENNEITFLLYSWDPNSRHKLCYKGTVHLLTVLRESPVHSLALKLEPRGTLYLKIHYKDPRQSFQRLPAPSSSGVFGVDLETVVARENTGFGIPLVVKKCLDEIEKRGLDSVGIYRLCGSAVRKKILRDAFERTTWMVDLSIEHVPDINVITGVLKDYLRELSEPLFTKGLFDMLVDGLSVCLPDDPEGNAKLMFSILECLPKVNRCTAMVLMDHLKLVSNHSERNKMTSQSLAMCFGPVVMCHTETGDPAVDLRKTIDVFRYLIDIWPAKKVSGNGSSDSSNNEQNGHPAQDPEEEKKTVAWSVGHQVLPISTC